MFQNTSKQFYELCKKQQLKKNFFCRNVTAFYCFWLFLLNFLIFVFYKAHKIVLMYFETLNCMENVQQHADFIAIWCVEFESETHFIIESNACAIQIDWINMYDLVSIFPFSQHVTFDLVDHDKINFDAKLFHNYRIYY